MTTTEPSEKRQTVKTKDGRWTLYAALPSCDHVIRAKELFEGGGLECVKCKGWYCA